MRSIAAGLIITVKVLIVGGAIIAVLSVVAPMTVISPVILMDQWYRRLVPYPPLVRDVPSPEEFDTRISTAFPIGFRHIDLIRRLKDEGFRPEWHWPPEELPSVGVYEITSWPCRYRFSVSWQADGDGRISQVKGKVHTTCL